MTRRVSLPMAMTVREAISIAGTLGHPSKMPGFSYGISALQCKRGGEMRKIPGSVCASCYAMTKWYRTWVPLLAGHARRFKGLTHPRWCDAMVRMIDAKCSTPATAWFRWHDSGDLQGVWHLANIVQVAARTPTVRHWLPTREYAIVDEFLAQGGRIPSNLVVRLSAEMIDAEPDIVRRFPRLAGLPTSTVQTAAASSLGLVLGERKGWIECRAVEARDNKCGPCRACWAPEVANVSYPQH